MAAGGALIMLVLIGGGAAFYILGDSMGWLPTGLPPGLRAQPTPASGASTGTGTGAAGASSTPSTSGGVTQQSFMQEMAHLSSPRVGSDPVASHEQTHSTQPSTESVAPKTSAQVQSAVNSMTFTDFGATQLKAAANAMRDPKYADAAKEYMQNLTNSVPPHSENVQSGEYGFSFDADSGPAPVDPKPKPPPVYTGPAQPSSPSDAAFF